MARYETYRSNAAEVPIMRKWIVRAFILSLLLHVGLFVFFKLKQLENFSLSAGEQLAPSRFVVKQATIDPRLLEQEDLRLTVPDKVPNATITVPEDKPEVKEIHVKPQISEIATPLLNDKPKSSPLNWEALTQVDPISAGKAEKSLSNLATAFLETSVRSPNQRVITVPKGSKGDGVNGFEGIPGRQTIDEALGNIGGSGGTDKPIGMPGGALFEYDKADLRPEAIDELKKIAKLISLYPKATFIISGHTDAIGGPEYNAGLSERRADAVKEWLVQSMGVAPERIMTIGKGSAELIVPGDKSVDEQQPNRRVEIVIKTNRK